MLKYALLGLVAMMLGTASFGATAADDKATTTSGPATSQAAKVDVGNTKCIVMAEDEAGDGTVEYQGKLYHICCKSCVKTFNKNPEKYVKALEAGPAKYGVTK